MNVSKIVFVLSLTVCLMLGSVFGFCLQNGILSRHGTSKVTGNVYVTIQDYAGIRGFPVGNVITNIGENQTGLRMFDNASYVGVQWISLSNDASPDQTWTKLPSETTTYGSSRKVASLSAVWMSASDYSRNITATFTFTSSIQLQCTGAQWNFASGSDNNLYACAAFTQTIFESNWNLTITWAFTYNGN